MSLFILILLLLALVFMCIAAKPPAGSPIVWMCASFACLIAAFICIRYIGLDTHTTLVFPPRG